MIYDTMSDWTVILDSECDNQQIPNNYDRSASSSANELTDSKLQKVDLGSLQFTGVKVTENMCLRQNKNQYSNQ